MKALSIRQPYAFAIVFGYKPVENRGWGTTFRGRVLIHASLKEERDAVEDVVAEIANQTGRAESVIADEYLANRHLGAIVGAATITDCVRDMNSRWFFGPHGFVLADPKPCKPVACRGKLGFFDVPEEVAEAVRQIAKEAA
jgi:hypothetical protein